MQTLSALSFLRGDWNDHELIENSLKKLMKKLMKKLVHEAQTTTPRITCLLKTMCCIQNMSNVYSRTSISNLVEQTFCKKISRPNFKETYIVLQPPNPSFEHWLSLTHIFKISCFTKHYIIIFSKIKNYILHIVASQKPTKLFTNVHWCSKVFRPLTF